MALSLGNGGGFVLFLVIGLYWVAWLLSGKLVHLPLSIISADTFDQINREHFILRYVCVRQRVLLSSLVVMDSGPALGF